MKRVSHLMLALTLLVALLAPAARALADAAPPVEAGHDAAAAHSDEVNPIPGPAAGFITALTTLLVFLGLVVILGKYAWGPISAGLKAREDKIRADIDAAERARGQADAARRQYEQQLAGAEQRVRELMAQAQADGQQLAARIKAQAQEDAEEIKQRTMREIEQGRREALEQIRAEAANLATAVAEKILRREVNREDQKRLIEASLDELQTVGSGA